MKTTAILLGLAFLTLPAGIVLSQTKGRVDRNAVRSATTSLSVDENRKISLTYRTISATEEMNIPFAMKDNPEGRAIYEQAMSQKMMQAVLNVDVPVEIGGIPIAPGRYGLGLSGFKDGVFDLAVLEGRTRHNLPLHMNPVLFDSPQVVFTLCSLSAKEAALIFHARKFCGRVRISILEDTEEDED